MNRKKKESSELQLIEKRKQWNMLFPLLEAVLDELKILSKSKPTDALNSFKAKSINKILEKIKSLLFEEPTNEFLELIDEDMLPTNSDVVLMVVQFKSAMEQFEKMYLKLNDTDLDSYNFGMKW